MRPPKRILVVDDSPLLLEIARDRLQSEGFVAATAEDIRQLDAQLAGGAPDLLVVDVQMPEAFGDDVAMVLRKVRGLQVPVCLFSSLGEAELAFRCRQAGLDAFLSKREGIEALVEKVHELLRGSART